MDSTDESSTDDDSDYGSISTNATKDIWYGIQIHPDNNTRYSIFKIHDRIRKTQSELKVSELSEKSIGKGIHKLFKVVMNKLRNSLLTLGE